jgi:hypothetical protein
LAAVTVLQVLMISACSSQPTDGPAQAPRQPPSVTFGAGFFNAEKDDTGLVWHWMGQEGTVTVTNPGRDVRLRLAAGAPVANAVLRLELNGEPLDEFTVEGGNFVKEYAVPAARQGTAPMSELHIVASEVLTSSHDTRQLGLRVFTIDWLPQ